MGILGREIKAGRLLRLLAGSIMQVICHGLLPICAFVLLFFGSFCLTVQAASETYPIVHDINMSNADAYIALEETSASYEVIPGDCLWAIAERFWGDGSRYVEIVNANQEIIEDPNLIYPGTLLQIGQTGYIKKDRNSGVEMQQYSFRTPDTWTLGYLEEGEQSANFVLTGNGLCHIACLIWDKEEETERTVQDWEACCKLIEDYVGEQYAEAVSDLAFEHYRTGSDELYLYSYVYEADLTECGIDERAKINVCAGLKLTENIQAQFIGFAYDYDIHGAVRYAAADFHESWDKKYSSVNGNNMSIAPAYEWEPEGMFNPFPWVEGFIDNVFRRLTDTPLKGSEAKGAKDELLDGLHSSIGRE